jgi:SnoaL-like domain
MSLEILEAKSELRQLVDTFSALADEGRIPDQMSLLTPDARVQVYLGDDLAFDLTGTREVGETFAAFTANVSRSYHMVGQHVVEVDGDLATGTAYCQVRMVSEEDGGQVLTDSSVRYEDEYVRRGGRWLISSRVSRFTINDRRPLHA